MKQFFTVTLLLLCNILYAQTNPNINLEDGDLTHWDFFIGDYCSPGLPTTVPISVPTTSIPLPCRHSLTTLTGITGCVSSSTDYFGGFPIVAPDGGHYSLKLGGEYGPIDTCGETEKARYNVHVPLPPPGKHYSLIVRYAVVLEDAGHTPELNPRFEINTYHGSTMTPMPGGSLRFISDPSLTSTFLTSPYPSLHGSTVYYKPWSNMVVNLSGYEGEMIVVEFSKANCAESGHMAYAYVDLSCELMDISGSVSCGSPTATFTAPSGFEHYVWYDAATFTVLYGIGQTISVPVPPSPILLAVQMLPDDLYITLIDTLYTTLGYPSPPITGPSDVCVGASITLSTAMGGVWSSSNPLIASASGAGVIAGVSAGTCTISCVSPDGCLSETEITVHPLPSTPSPISGTSIMCVDSTSALSSTTSGGTWSTSAPAIATVSSLGVITGIASGTATISYAVANSCGSAAVSMVVTVNSAPAPPAAITGAGTICIGATTTLASATSGGAWSTSDPAVATISGSGIVTGIASGTAMISYSVTNSCGSTAATMSITVNSLPPTPAPISGEDTVCVGATISLLSATTGGVWSSTMPAIATVSSTGIITGIASGTMLVSYTITNSCGSTAATKLIHVSPLPLTPSPITGTATLEVGGTTTLSNAVGGGSWSSDAPSVATVSSAGVVSGHSVGTAGISYAISNECGTEVVRQTVTVDPAPSVQVAGIDNDSRLTVYPNPTSGEVTIRCKARTALPVQIEVADLIGRTLFSKSADWMGNEIKVDCSYLPDGIYLLSIRNAELLQTTKLTVRH